MLVLKRNPNQKIFIGNNIVVMVTKIIGNRVYLGIEAPDDVMIAREEAKNLTRKIKEKKDEC